MVVHRVNLRPFRTAGPLGSLRSGLHLGFSASLHPLQEPSLPTRTRQHGKVQAFKRASHPRYWTVVPVPGAWADETAAVWFLELLFLFHFQWDLNTQHQQNNATLVQQAIEAERKARKAERQKAWNAAHPESLAAANKKWNAAHPERRAAANKKWFEAKGWEAQLAVVARGGGGAAGRAARAEQRQQVAL